MSDLRAPQFDGPVKRGGDEEVREINRSCSTVAAQSSHRTMVAFKHLCNARLTAAHARKENDFTSLTETSVAHKETTFPTASPAVTTGGVDRAILAAHHKVIYIPQRKRHGCHGHRLALFEHQLQAVLWARHGQL